MKKIYYVVVCKSFGFRQFITSEEAIDFVIQEQEREELDTNSTAWNTYKIFACIGEITNSIEAERVEDEFYS